VLLGYSEGLGYSVGYKEGLGYSVARREKRLFRLLFRENTDVVCGDRYQRIVDKQRLFQNLQT